MHVRNCVPLPPHATSRLNAHGYLHDFPNLLLPPFLAITPTCLPYLLALSLLNPTSSPAQEAQSERAKEGRECEPYECRIRLRLSTPRDSIGVKIDRAVIVFAAVDDHVVH